MEKVLIGCKLPNGLVLHHPLASEVKVTLEGLNKVRIVGSDHMLTSVDADFWEDWKRAHGKSFEPYLSGAIFEAKTQDEATQKAKDLSKVKTGFEPKNPTDGNVKPAS